MFLGGPCLVRKGGQDITLLDLLNVFTDLSDLANHFADVGIHIWLIRFIGDSETKKNRTV